MSSAIEQYKEHKKTLKVIKSELKALAKQAFKEMSASVFEKHPIVVGFAWAQYTPYFNDGNECIFSARTEEPDMIFLVDGEEKEIDGWSVPSGEKWSGELRKCVPVEMNEEDLKQKSAYEATQKFLATFDEDELKQMFGDHVRVTVRKDDVSVDDYSHD